MIENRIIVAGGRDFASYAFMCHVLDRLLGKTPHVHGQPLRRDIEIVSGHARGADRLGEKWARENRVPVTKFPAKWKRDDGRIDYGAGLARNIEMADYATHLVAFWDGQSRGTAHMIRTAKDKGLKGRVYGYGTNQAVESF